jgi:hypothetical protein
LRNTIILGSLLALIGIAPVAQASDWYKGNDRAAQVHRESDARPERYERDEHDNRSRRQHHAEERRQASHEMHNESHERRHHR